MKEKDRGIIRKFLDLDKKLEDACDVTRNYDRIVDRHIVLFLKVLDAVIAEAA
jgi:hypothetical protein